MKVYAGAGRGAGLIAYQSHAESIAVQFRDGAIYLYTFASAGQRNVQIMKKLAAGGKGLTTYISQNVKSRYERKL